MDSYLVPARDATAEIEVKRSRFLCRVARVESEHDARTVIAEERRAYGTAGHHCSAFILGPDGATLRSNDDGEPSGTAGPPILDALQGAQLSDVVAVVTRAALRVAGTRRREQRQRLETTVDFAIAGRLEDQLRRIAAIEVDYDTGLPRLRAAVATADLEDVNTLILTASNGSARITELSPSWVDAD